MDPYRSSVVEKLLLDPSTTPEKALLSLSSPIQGATIPPVSNLPYPPEDKESGILFILYLRFIMTRRPDGCVDGIWEDILRKALMFSRDVSYVRNAYAGMVGIPVSPWLKKALSSPSKCPDPYIRLELFRLIRIFCTRTDKKPWDFCEHLGPLIMDTLSCIQPHRLLRRGDVDDVLFDIDDLHSIIQGYDNQALRKSLKDMITTNIISQVAKRPHVFDDTKEVKFISNCIKLIGVFAFNYRFIANHLPVDQIVMIGFLLDFFSFFRGPFASFIDCDGFTWRASFDSFIALLTRLPFRHNVTETLRELTASIINNEEKDHYYKYIYGHERDRLVRRLEVCTKVSDLPGLLLSRQVQGHAMAVRQHCLLLKNLELLYPNAPGCVTDSEEDDIDFEDSDDEDYDDWETEDVDMVCSD